MKIIDNYHILTVAYMGPTNYRGSRVKIHSDRFKQSKIIDYDYECNNSFEVAQTWLELHGFNLIGKGEADNGYYIITTTFEPLKATK